MARMTKFLFEERGASAIDWTALGAGVISLGAAVVTDVYIAAMNLIS